MLAQVFAEKVHVRNPGNDGSLLALQEISLSFQMGERIGLMGRNGSGKTTLVRLLGGLDAPTRGRISRVPGSAKVMLVLQRPEDHFVRSTVGEQVSSFSPRRLAPKSVHKLLDQVGLPDVIGLQPPLRLSTGQQRLVAIACALASEAPLIIMDEPMAGLDYQGRQMVRQALLRLQSERDLGWVMVSHHPDDMLGLIERVWILDSGRLIYDGPFDAVPVDTLKLCLSVNDVSLYFILRQMEARGIIFQDSPYCCTHVEQFSALFQKAHVP